MNRILDILIPRFITERVALIEANDGHLEIACALSDVRPGERFDAIATMRGVNLLGRIIFPRMIGAPTVAGVHRTAGPPALPVLRRNPGGRGTKPLHT